MQTVLKSFYWLFSFIKRHWILTLVVLLLGPGLVGGYFYRQSVQANNKKLVTQKPQIENLTKTLQVSGVVDAKEKASLRFAAGGKVVYVGAKPGDTVKKGQTIATIDRRELEKRLQQDLNSYMRERWDWEGTQDTTDYHVEPLTTRRRIDKEQWDLNDTVLDVEIRDIAIRNTLLSAPFGGILVSAPTTVPGLNLMATDAFEVVNPDTLVFKAAVDEADIGQVKIGQAAKINLDSYPDDELPTAVTSIDYKSSVSSSGTVFLVELPLSQTSLTPQLRLGMNGDVNIVLDTRQQVMTIPLDATKERDGKTYVDIKTGDKTTAEREIQIDMETDDKVEVTSGLSLDDEVVIPS